MMGMRKDDRLSKVQTLVSDGWPGWEVQDLLGRGTYGAVYKAVKKTRTGKNVYCAVKYMSVPGRSGDVLSLREEGYDEASLSELYRSVVRDYMNEVRVMRALKGAPNIVRIEDARVLEKKTDFRWEILIRMELLTSLSGILEKGNYSRGDVIRLGLDMAQALADCRKLDIIHRDIKPGNIFIDQNGTYKLGDFGTARNLERTQGGLSVKGTYNYMAPEVYHGRSYGPSVDIYSVGMVMYRMCNGGYSAFIDPSSKKHTYEEMTSSLTKRMSGHELPAPVNADPELAQIILKACAYDPGKRYRSPAELMEALRRLEEKNTADETAGAQTGDAFSLRKQVSQGWRRIRWNAKIRLLRIRLRDQKARKQKTLTDKAGPGKARTGPLGSEQSHSEQSQSKSLTSDHSQSGKYPSQQYEAETPSAGRTFRRKRLIIAVGLAAAGTVVFFIFYFWGLPGLNSSGSSSSGDSSLEASEKAALSAGRENAGNEGAGIQTTNTAEANSKAGGTALAEAGRFVSWEDAGLTNHVMDWQDEALEAAIRDWTGISNGDITLKDVWNMTELDIPYYGIENISALSEMTNLHTLKLQDNAITDVQPLSGLTNLTDLELDDNQVTDLTPLSGLTKLEILFLDRNGCSDITPIRNLTRLTNLTLKEDGVTDISVLSGFHSLQQLYLNGNPDISDYTPLRGLTEIEELVLDDNPVGDTSMFDEMSSMKEISLRNTGLENIEFIRSMPELEDADLSENEISDLSPLESCPKLTNLQLNDNPVKDIRPLSALAFLDTLSLGNTEVTDLSPLDGLGIGVIYISSDQSDMFDRWVGKGDTKPQVQE